MRHVAGEADAGKEQDQHPELARPDPAQGTNRALREQRQDDDGHHAEARRRPHLLVVYPLGEIVQPRLLHQEERRQGDDAARERQPPEPGGHASRDDDECGGLARGVDIARAGDKVAGDDERHRARREDDGETQEVPRREPSGQAGDPAEHGEGANATEARVRSAGVAGALPLDANGRAAERRHGDSQEARCQSLEACSHGDDSLRD